MNEFDSPTPVVPLSDTPSVTDAPDETAPAEGIPVADTATPVDPVRSAAGRLGGKRVHTLALLGREYEKEHGLKAGRQRQKQLIQLGKRYEVEHGLRTAKPCRKRQGDAWQEFLTALARIIKPVHRAAVEQFVDALGPGPGTAPAHPVTDKAA